MSIFASEIANKILIDDNNIKEIVRISSLLHDIGKICEDFQKLLKNIKKESKSKYRHNEVGWAFLSKYLNLNNKEIQKY